MCFSFRPDVGKLLASPLCSLDILHLSREAGQPCRSNVKHMWNIGGQCRPAASERARAHSGQSRRQPRTTPLFPTSRAELQNSLSHRQIRGRRGAKSKLPEFLSTELCRLLLDLLQSNTSLCLFFDKDLAEDFNTLLKKKMKGFFGTEVQGIVFVFCVFFWLHTLGCTPLYQREDSTLTQF